MPPAGRCRRAFVPEPGTAPGAALACPGAGRRRHGSIPCTPRWAGDGSQGGGGSGSCLAAAPSLGDAAQARGLGRIGLQEGD